MRLDKCTSSSPLPGYSCTRLTTNGPSYKLLLGLLLLLPGLCLGVTMQQFVQSLDMMRNGCAPKFKVPVEVLDRMRDGHFEPEPSQDLLCYTKCIAQLAGTLTKKGEFSVSKAFAQMPIILPAELVEAAKAALNHCKDVQKTYKDSCQKIFYTSKCIADFDRANFKFP